MTTPKRHPVRVICQHCGNNFFVHPYRRDEARYCGRQCQNTALSHRRWTAPLAERFWSKVDKDGPIIRPELGPCWIWTANTYKHGYGQFMDRRPKRAHRVAWELTYGRPLLPTQHACHRCDNPPCVRPDHLFLGTPLENARDCVSKGRNGSRTKPESRVRGDRVNTAKLTNTQYNEVRALYAVGDMTYRAIGQRFGVTKEAIFHIVRRQRPLPVAS